MCSISIIPNSGIVATIQRMSSCWCLHYCWNYCHGISIMVSLVPSKITSAWFGFVWFCSVCLSSVGFGLVQFHSTMLCKHNLSYFVSSQHNINTIYIMLSFQTMHVMLNQSKFCYVTSCQCNLHYASFVKFMLYCINVISITSTHFML